MLTSALFILSQTYKDVALLNIFTGNTIIICEGAWEKGPIGHNNHLEIWALKVALIFTRQ